MASQNDKDMMRTVVFRTPRFELEVRLLTQRLREKKVTTEDDLRSQFEELVKLYLDELKGKAKFVEANASLDIILATEDLRDVLLFTTSKHAEHMIRKHLLSVIKAYLRVVGGMTPVVVTDEEKFNLQLASIGLSAGSVPGRKYASNLPMDTSTAVLLSLVVITLGVFTITLCRLTRS